MDIEISDQYFLSRSIEAHQGAARTAAMHGSKLVTGGIDNKVAYFERNDKGDLSLVKEYKFFPAYIYTILIIDDHQFAVGCKDSKIYICSFGDENSPLVVLEGHKDAVNSLSLKDEILVSGSWDASAKIWSLVSGECIATLTGHAYAVSVLIASTEMIYTGSQDGNLHQWDRAGNKLNTYEKAHANIIREIKEAPGIGLYTCSNDAAIKLWSSNLDLLATYSQIHTTFVFALELLSDSGFASGGEDQKVSIVNGGAVVQEILHPGTIWCITSDCSKSKDIVTACSDGFIRIFSRVASKKASLDEINSLQTEGEMAAVRGGEIDQKTLQGLPTIDKIHTIKGKKEDDVKLFRDGDIAKAYAWKGGKWVLFGDVIGQQFPKKMYEGDRYFPKGEYDYIFDVEDDSGITRKLPFNDGDNIYTAAEKFLNKEQMSIRFKEQIVNFIHKNIRPQGQVQKASQSIQESSALQPFRETYFYKKANIDGLQKKTLEINEILTAANHPDHIKENELKYFNSLVVKLRDPKIFNYIKEFSSFEIEMLKRLERWPAEHCVPIFDLFRVFITHPASQHHFSGLDSGMGLLVPLIGKLTQGPPVLWSLYAKILSNFFLLDMSPQCVVKCVDIILDSFNKLNMSVQTHVALIANFYMNFSANIDLLSSATDEIVGKFLGFMLALIEKGDLNEEAVVKLSIALVNISVLRPSCKNALINTPSQRLSTALASTNSPVKARLIESLRLITS